MQTEVGSDHVDDKLTEMDTRLEGQGKARASLIADDLEHRSRRNNVRLTHLPEGTEVEEAHRVHRKRSEGIAWAGKPSQRRRAPARPQGLRTQPRSQEL